MRTFDVHFKHKNKTLVYRRLDGKKAIKIMEDLTSKGFKPEATTEANNIIEWITLKQMKECIIIF